jgi:hypothetical protein
MANNDILLTNDDLLIQGGDLVTGLSDEQHIADTIMSSPGWWKENPQDGVGITQYVNSTGREQEISRKIRLHLTSDGYNVGSPTVKVGPSGYLFINPDASTR